MAEAAHLVSSLLLIETSFLPETRLLLRGVVEEVFRKTDKVGVVFEFCKELVTKYPQFSEVRVMGSGTCVACLMGFGTYMYVVCVMGSGTVCVSTLYSSGHNKVYVFYCAVLVAQSLGETVRCTSVWHGNTFISLSIITFVK